MYLPYKNAYKRPFCSNINALKRRKILMEKPIIETKIKLLRINNL